MKFDLTEQEAQVVLDALTAQPYRVVAALIAKVMDQAKQQQLPQQQLPQTEPEKPDGQDA